MSTCCGVGWPPGDGIADDISEVSEEGHGIHHLLVIVDILVGRPIIVLVEFHGM